MSTSAWRGHSAALAAQRPMRHADEMHRASIAGKATRMHDLGRLRGQHFGTALLADSAMDMMLALFVGELHASPVSDTALAGETMLSREEIDLMIDKLINAGLIAITGANPDRRTVGLTPLGSARMRSFVNAYPDV